jgi:hypothetical protein
MKNNYEFEKLLSHVGHELECVKYGYHNVSIECVDCNEVIISIDNKLN